MIITIAALVLAVIAQLVLIGYIALICLDHFQKPARMAELPLHDRLPYELPAYTSPWYSGLLVNTNHEYLLGLIDELDSVRAMVVAELEPAELIQVSYPHE